MPTQVNLTKRIKLPDGSRRYCPAVLSRNGLLKPGVVFVDGSEQKHPGPYYLDWSEKKTNRRIRLAVGEEPIEALTARDRKAAELEALAQGIVVEPAPGAKLVVGTNLEEVVKTYLADIKLDKKPSTYAAYTTALQYFLESCAVKDPLRKHRTIGFVEEIELRDMRRFKSYLKETREQGPRSIWNKFNAVMSFLKVHGKSSIVAKGDWPTYTEEDVEIYEQEELDALWAVTTPDEALVWKFFLGTGMRSQEVAHFTAQDINFKHRTVRVRHKPSFNWTPKAYKEREIPIALSLLQLLEPLRNQKGLLFPTPKGKVEHHYWERLRAQARRIDPALEMPEENYHPHKFRASFCTHSLRQFDLRTVMAWAGHNDIKTTMRYLKPARNQDVRDKLDAL